MPFLFFLWISIICCWALITPSGAGVTAAEAAGLRAFAVGGEAATAPLGEVHRRVGGGSGVDLYRIDVPSPGLLRVEVADLAGEAAYPLLHDPLPPGRSNGFDSGSSGEAGEAGGPVTLERSSTHWVVRVREPGVVLVPVSTQAASGRGGDLTVYRMEVAFAPQASGLVETEPAPTNPDPEPVDEWDEDDVSLTTNLPSAPAVLAVPGGGRLCASTAKDDHGDSRACATGLHLGSRVRAELDRDAAPDFDVFVFELTDIGTVRLETRGDTDTHGRLFDDLGYRVAEDDDGGQGSNFRIVRTLPPGRYFLRVEGYRGAEGSYVLESVHLR